MVPAIVSYCSGHTRNKNSPTLHDSIHNDRLDLIPFAFGFYITGNAPLDLIRDGLEDKNPELREYSASFAKESGWIRPADPGWMER